MTLGGGPTNAEELAKRAWRSVVGRVGTASDVETALLLHLQATAERMLTDTEQAKTEGGDDKVYAALKQEIKDKFMYMDPAWGYVDAAGIAARVDDCAIALVEKTKREFLDSLDWDLLPHRVIVATVKAVLLLFDMHCPPQYSDEEVWKNYWGLWIIKNVDTHTGSWEWFATNEPVGLFTQPYALSSSFLPQVKRLLDASHELPESHRAWQCMSAYLCLREWAEASYAYVHMKTHCIQGFPGHEDVQNVTCPPRRTPQANVWFHLMTPEGVEYYYNRILQEIVLEKPADFDGGGATAIPNVVLQLVEDALRSDHATRLEIERRSHQRVRDKLLAEDEWVECVDVRTQQVYYYSFKYYKLSEVPPPSGVFFKQKDSVGYRAVLRLQTAYRKRRLEQKLQVKRLTRASLPTFAPATKPQKYY